MIKAAGLTKRFGGRTAVDRLEFEIPRGQVVAFLGPNGAGKTTTMRLLTAYLPADEGRAEIMGFDVAERPLEARRRLGYLPENNPLPEEFEVTDSLQFTARLRGITDATERAARIKGVIKTCGLKDAVGKKAGELSKGFRQRLGLAQAIVHGPDVLILDEPTSGLDPNQVLEVRALIAELRRDKTVLLSTHILSEAAAVCDRAIIISDGRIAADGAPESLVAAASGRKQLYVELKAAQSEAYAAFAALAGVIVSSSGQGLLLESTTGRDLREDVFALAVERRWPILTLKLETPSLEDVFRKLTQNA